jgi:hypothetical protein
VTPYPARAAGNPTDPGMTVRDGFRTRRVPAPDGPARLELENWFAGRVLDRIPLGDHCGFLLEPIGGEAHRSGAPLTFRRAKRIEPGHEA